jgi:hypothetical protein
MEIETSITGWQAQLSLQAIIYYAGNVLQLSISHVLSHHPSLLQLNFVSGSSFTWLRI